MPNSVRVRRIVGVEVNRTTWSTFTVTLADGQSWTQAYTFQINAAGLWKVQFFLFKDRDFSSAYRNSP